MEFNNQEQQFGNYDKLFDMQEVIKLWKVDTHSINLRLPHDINKLIDKEVELIKRTVGLRISKNELLVLAVMSFFNYKQDENNKESFYKERNESSLSNYLELYAQEVKSKVMLALYQREFEIATKKTTKTRTQQMRRIRLKQEEIKKLSE